MTRLEAMQRRIMLGDAAPARVATPAPRPAPVVGSQVAALRAALAAERKARLAAEARLRAVLSEIGRRSARQPTRAAPPAARAMIEVPALPPAEIEVLEGEVVDGGDVSTFDRIAALGGDDDDHEEAYDG
jgi:hypothetical protein